MVFYAIDRNGIKYTVILLFFSKVWNWTCLQIGVFRTTHAFHMWSLRTKHLIWFFKAPFFSFLTTSALPSRAASCWFEVAWGRFSRETYRSKLWPQIFDWLFSQRPLKPILADLPKKAFFYSQLYFLLFYSALFVFPFTPRHASLSSHCCLGARHVKIRSSSSNFFFVHRSFFSFSSHPYLRRLAGNIEMHVTGRVGHSAILRGRKIVLWGGYTRNSVSFQHRHCAPSSFIRSFTILLLLFSHSASKVTSWLSTSTLERSKFQEPRGPSDCLFPARLSDHFPPRQVRRVCCVNCLLPLRAKPAVGLLGIALACARRSLF